MNNKFDELARRLTQSVTRWRALKWFGVGIAITALAGFGLAVLADAQSSQLSPLVELSVPNPVGTCDDGFRLPGTMTPNDAAEPFVAVNPAHPTTSSPRGSRGRSKMTWQPLLSMVAPVGRRCRYP